MIHLLSGGRPGSFSEGPDFFFLPTGRVGNQHAFSIGICVCCVRVGKVERGERGLRESEVFHQSLFSKKCLS